MNLPAEFIRTIESTFAEEGRRFLADLPALIAEAAQRWGLTRIEPVPNLSYNYAAFAKRGDDEVVLKIGVPRPELSSEMAALRLFDSQGACRLMDFDNEWGFLLLERLHPGVMLSTLENDEAATHIAADVMLRIWRPLDDINLGDGSTAGPIEEQDSGGHSVHEFIRLSDWFDGFKRLQARFGGGTGPLDRKLVARAKKLSAELLAENHRPVLMHGDCHHFNILSSGRGWLVIDPKGVIGPAGYEVGPLLLNPWGRLPGEAQLRRLTRRRIDILHERLGFERRRLLDWGLAHAVLSAWWGIEDGTGWEPALHFAEVIADLN